jgi:hypothetical protein
MLLAAAAAPSSAPEHSSKEIAHVHVNAAAPSASTHSERKRKAAREATRESAACEAPALRSPSFHLPGLIIQSPLSIITQH